MEKRQVLQTSLRKEFLKERRILLDFLDEYKSVMETYTGLKVFGSVSEEGDAYYIDYGHGFYARLWYENGGY